MVKIIKKVAVIGGGTMGSGIAQHIAQKGVCVTVKEVDEERAGRCKDRICRQLDRVAQLGKISLSEADATKNRLSTTSSYEKIKDADLVIEAVFENIMTKKAVFEELNSVLPVDVVCATNSSSLSIDEIASATNRPDRFIGTHFFNPPVKAPLVELVRGHKTSDETFNVTKRFVQIVLGKTPILVKGCPGYLVNRLLLPYLNEAARLLTETRLTVSEIDFRANQFGWPMGPFKLLDYIGIDIAANVANILHNGYGERATPTGLMNRMVELGYIGNKTGIGFYNDDTDSKVEDINMIINREFPDRVNLGVEEGFKRMMAGFCNEALMCLEEEIGTADVIETGSTLGIMFPMALQGPLHYAQDKYGFINLLADLQRFEGECGMRFKPTKILEQLVADDKKIFQGIEEEEW